jgi:hypothetical protein
MLLKAGVNRATFSVFMANKAEEEPSYVILLPDFIKPTSRGGGGFEDINDGGLLIDPMVCGQLGISGQQVDAPSCLRWLFQWMVEM